MFFLTSQPASQRNTIRGGPDDDEWKKFSRLPRSQLQIRKKSTTTTNVLTNCNFFAPPPPPVSSSIQYSFRTLRAILSSVSPLFLFWFALYWQQFPPRSSFVSATDHHHHQIVIVCTRSIPFISCTINKWNCRRLGRGETRRAETLESPPEFNSQRESSRVESSLGLEQQHPQTDRSVQWYSWSQFSAAEIFFQFQGI